MSPLAMSGIINCYYTLLLLISLRERIRLRIHSYRAIRCLVDFTLDAFDLFFFLKLLDQPFFKPVCIRSVWVYFFPPCAVNLDHSEQNNFYKSAG